MKTRTNTILTAVAATCLMASSGCVTAPKVDNFSPSSSTDALIFKDGLIREVRLTDDKVRLLREAEVMLKGVDGIAQPNTSVVASEIDGLIRSKEKPHAVWLLISGRNILLTSVESGPKTKAQAAVSARVYSAILRVDDALGFTSEQVKDQKKVASYEKKSGVK